MFNIGQFLAKISDSRAKDILLRENARQTINKVAGTDLPNNSISIKSGIIYLSGIGYAVRSEIYIKKTNIIKTIKDLHGTVIKDIR